ncbi:hypothetical protein [Synechococcus phage S-B68]|nr:hypothetical protein [Synechococcus phage S-B68]
MSILKYPKELNEDDVDYITFRSFEYRTNKAYEGQSQAGGVSGPGQGSTIVLYMPTTTPAMNQGADWGAVNFDGPLGQLKGNLAAGTAGAIMDADISSFEAGKTTGKRLVNDIKNQFEAAMKQGGGAVKQLGVNAVAGMAGMQPNQLLALQRGQIYNPNVELLYNGPRLRGFSMSFTFVPKSEDEAKIINEIILEFKKWSSPKDLGKGMFKVPNVWQVTYMTGGRKNRNMNEFKRAALTDVAVQHNQGMNMHMSFDDGMPVITTVSLNFTEVDIVTRDDHEKSSSYIGY